MAGSVVCVQIALLWRARGLACLRIVPCEHFQEGPSGTAGRPGSSPPAPATHSAGADHPACRTRKRSIAVQETRRCGCADGSVVTGARLDVRDLAQIPGSHLGTGLPSCSAR